MPDAGKDFFISYNKNDLQIAEWIAWELEEAQYSVIIQAWDFKGNWVYEMDKAMKLCKRTIAVLSSNYINASYTFSEWANSFINDPKGEKDKIITIRVEDIELEDGILRQLEYVDFVNKTESEAKELLLKRVKGERGKPSAKPTFNLNTQSSGIKHEAVSQKPVFSAAMEDDERMKKLREIIVQWRGKYALETKRMDDYAEELASWQKKAPSDFNDEISAVIQFAYKIACDFKELPLTELEKAKAYGLQIHSTVFWGQAIKQAFHMNDIFDEEGIKLYRQKNMLREKQGMGPLNLMPDEYSYELLERLLRSAIALFNFNIDDLPRGFLQPTIEQAATGIDNLSQLALAQFNYDPRLYLISVDGAIKKISSFAARKLTLYVLCARVNASNKLDILASDAENLYVWQSSVQQPVYQFAYKNSIVAATLHGQSNLLWASYLTSKGVLFNIGEDGTLSNPPCCFQSFDLNTAVFWSDPLNKDDWYVIVSTDKHEIYAALHGETLTGALNTDGNFWQDPLLISESEKEDNKLLNEYQKSKGSNEIHELKIYWESECEVKMTHLDGLPCLLLYRHANTGTRLFFLDPVTLGFLRSPVIIEGFLYEVSVACGRWLVVGFFQSREPSPRLKIWDLRASGMVECGSWLHDQGDIYTPIIADETKTSFHLLFIHRYLNTGEKNSWRLMSFKWPEEEIKEIERFEKLLLAPVESS